MQPKYLVVHLLFGYLNTFATDMDENNLLQGALDEETKLKWYKIVFQLKKDFGKKPDLNGFLFLIGMREVGSTRTFSKEEKMDLMHVATCALLSLDGYYELEYTDSDGWPHYKQLKQPQYADLSTQENYLRKLIVRYFERNELLED